MASASSSSSASSTSTVPDSTAAPPECFKIVLTGGPCAGKTTALARVSNFLRSRGFTVYSVPEAATLIFQNGGAFFDQGAEEDVIVFQTKLIKLQMHLEDTFEELARTSAARTAAAAGKQGGKRPVGSQKAVLLCDRGTLDGSAYMDAAGWAKLMAHNGMDTVTLRDQRYNAVFHLVTAADGAEAFFGHETNETRTETPAQARDLDARVMRAWVGHPRLLVFDNRTGDGTFEAKMRRVVNAVSRHVGLPSTTRRFRKFLLRARELPCDADLPLGRDGFTAQRFEVEKVYLRAPSSIAGGAMSPPPPKRAKRDDDAAAAAAAGGGGGGGGGDGAGAGASASAASAASAAAPSPEYSFVRRRSSGNHSAYGQTTVRSKAGEAQSKVETKRIIQKHEYYALVKAFKDPTRVVVHQRRLCFLWAGNYFEIYEYANPRMCVLNCQMSHTCDDASPAASPAASPTKAAKTAAAGANGASPANGAGVAAAAAAAVAKPKGPVARLRRTRSESLSLEFPPFVRVEREVTGERAFSAYHLSLRASAGGPAGDDGPALRGAEDGADGPSSTLLPPAAKRARSAVDSAAR